MVRHNALITLPTYIWWSGPVQEQWIPLGQQSASLPYWSLVFLAAFGLGLLYLLFHIKAVRQRTMATLKEQQLHIDQERSETAFRRAEAELKFQIELLEEKSNLVARLEDELEVMRERVQRTSSAEILREAVALLAEARILTSKDWSVFRLKFNAVFDDSLDRLKSVHPDVTPSEERIYALNQLGVDTKTMAGMLGISPESVRKARYRLKKRLESDHSP